MVLNTLVPEMISILGGSKTRRQRVSTSDRALSELEDGISLISMLTICPLVTR